MTDLVEGHAGTKKTRAMELMASEYTPVDNGDRQSYLFPLHPCIWV